MKRDRDAAAGRRNVPVGAVMTGLAEAEPQAVREREKDPQAFALIDDVGDGAREAVRGGIGVAVVDQEFFAVHREHKPIVVRDGPRAAQHRRTERNAGTIDAAYREQARLADETGDKGVRGMVVKALRLVDLHEPAVL